MVDLPTTEIIEPVFLYNRTKDGGIIWDGRHAFTSNHVHFYPCLFSYRKLGAIKKLFSKK